MTLGKEDLRYYLSEGQYQKIKKELDECFERLQQKVICQYNIGCEYPKHVKQCDSMRILKDFDSDKAQLDSWKINFYHVEKELKEGIKK